MDDNTTLIPCNVTMSKGSDLANYGTLPCYMSNQKQEQPKARSVGLSWLHPGIILILVDFPSNQLDLILLGRITCPSSHGWLILCSSSRVEIPCDTWRKILHEWIEMQDFIRSKYPEDKQINGIQPQYWVNRGWVQRSFFCFQKGTQLSILKVLQPSKTWQD